MFESGTVPGFFKDGHGSPPNVCAKLICWISYESLHCGRWAQLHRHRTLNPTTFKPQPRNQRLGTCADEVFLSQPMATVQYVCSKEIQKQQHTVADELWGSCVTQKPAMALLFFSDTLSLKNFFNDNFSDQEPYCARLLSIINFAGSCNVANFKKVRSTICSHTTFLSFPTKPRFSMSERQSMLSDQCARADYFHENNFHIIGTYRALGLLDLKLLQTALQNHSIGTNNLFTWPTALDDLFIGW